MGTLVPRDTREQGTKEEGREKGWEQKNQQILENSNNECPSQSVKEEAAFYSKVWEVDRNT